MNIYDISKEANVSTATVSRVLNGNAKVSEKTRAAVMEVIERHGYQPSALARGLSLKSMSMIGIMAADCKAPFLALAIHYLEDFLRDKNYSTVLCCTGYELENKKKRLEFLLTKNVDAVILVGSGFVDCDDFLNQYIRDAADKIPVMLINASMSYPNIYSVACDDRKAIYEATQWLYRTGSENVLFVYNQKSYSGIRKLAGFHEAARTYDKDWDGYSIYCPNEITNVHDIADFIEAIYKSGLKFDAGVTADDNLAAGVVKFSKRMSIPVPEKLRVIGFNNSYITEYCEPELSSIDNRLEDLCRICVDATAGLLEDNNIPHNEMLSAKLVLRGST